MASFNRVTFSGSTDTISVPFGYLDKSHVVVSLDGVVLASGAYSWPSNGQVKITAGNPAAGVVGEARRVTPATPLVNFEPGNLDTDDLDTASLQAIYIAEEAKDTTSDVDGRAWYTAGFQLGGTITKGSDGFVAVFDADGNIIPGYDTGDIAAAQGYATAALGYRDDAGAFSTSASQAATLAQAWATSASLVGGTDYSAKYYAQLAATTVTGKVDKAGDTLTGLLILKAGTTGSASFTLPDGVAPTSPLNGNIWRSDANGGLLFRKGGSTVGIVDTQRTIKSAKAHLTDTKAQGTNSQALSATTWNIRQINTENSDPDGIVTISSNTFALLAGSDYTVRASVVGLAENTSNQRSVVRFFNVTDGVAVPVTQPIVSTTSTLVMGQSVEAILTGGKTYRVEQYTTGSVAGGIGANNISGVSEVYLSIMIERLTNGIT